MEPRGSRRQTWLACPACGHTLAKVCVCDIEFKCKYCGCEFEAIIALVPHSGPSLRQPNPLDRKTSN